MDIFIEELPKEDMWMSNRVKTERTQAWFLTDGNGKHSSAAMPGSFLTQYVREVKNCRHEEGFGGTGCMFTGMAVRRGTINDLSS